MQRLILKKPPIVEFVLGIQFSPLINLTAAHYGLFWEVLGRDEWKSTSDEPLIVDQIETFDRPRWQIGSPANIRFGIGSPLGRTNFAHASGTKLIQLQPTRLLQNWTKTDNFKPSYTDLFASFSKTVHDFVKFAETERLGPFQPNQWELTYVDMFPHGEDWNSPSEWSRILPALFNDFQEVDGLKLNLDYRGAEWSFEIVPQQARLHVSARAGRWRDACDALILTMTARGSLEDLASLQQCFDLGHEKAIQLFLRVVSPDLIKKWS